MGTVETPRASVTDSFRQKKIQKQCIPLWLTEGRGECKCELLLNYILGVEPLLPMVRQSQSIIAPLK